jgi:cardiolipin synthase
MLPTFVSLFADGRVVAGSWFFGLLASTDWIDGYIARRFNQVSELGKILDPIADRTVFFVGIGAALYYNPDGRGNGDGYGTIPRDAPR